MLALRVRAVERRGDVEFAGLEGRRERLRTTRSMCSFSGLVGLLERIGHDRHRSPCRSLSSVPAVSAILTAASPHRVLAPNDAGREARLACRATRCIFASGVPVFGVSTTSADISSVFSSMNSRTLSSFESSSSALMPPVDAVDEPVERRLLRGVLVGGLLLAVLGDRQFELADDKRLHLGRDAVDANDDRGDRAVVLREEGLRARSTPSGRGRPRIAPRTGSRWRSAGRPR